MRQADLKESVRRRYGHPAEVRQYTANAAEGITPFEAALIRLAFAPGQKILDIGCGGGREAIPMAQYGLKVVGMDLIPTMVQAARGCAIRNRQTIDYVVGDVATLPFCDRSFDGAVMLEQLIAFIPGHDHRLEVFQAVWRSLRPGGTLALTTHNRRCHVKFRLYFACVNRLRRLARRLGCGGGLEDNDRMGARVSRARVRQQPVFFHMYDLDEVVADLRAAGFEVEVAKARAEFEAGREDLALREKDYLLGFIARRPEH
ncbi:MAG: class I SAM-dependent methyltransferase [Nitrospirae bacterium]|nr:MAG: class I SAM-dependent methyltransferase [Nitrospirota bacterium]